jgi:hypothetical protein
MTFRYAVKLAWLFYLLNPRLALRGFNTRTYGLDLKTGKNWSIAHKAAYGRQIKAVIKCV